MRKLLVAVALVGLATITGGADNPKPDQDKKEPPKKEKPATALQVGDPAPALGVSKWLQGEEVREFKPGKVYVIEFWATWCGWCLHLMPHTAELQTQYKDKGVTFIFYSAKDPDNTEEKVAAFVKRRGPKLKCIFAYTDDRTAYDAWAGERGLPWAFVVDKTGRIAYSGHPMYLGVVLPRVVAGDAKAQAVSEEVGKIQEEWRAALGDMTDWDPRARLKALKDFEAKYPPLANNPVFVRVKLSHLPTVGEVDEAKKLAEEVVAKAIKQDDPAALSMVSALLRSRTGSKELMALAVKAAEAMVRMAGDKDAPALINLAQTYFDVGEKAKARVYARKAVEAAAGESAALKRRIEQQARMFDDEKKEDQK